MARKKLSEKPSLTQHQWRKAKVVQLEDGTFKIYYPLDEILDENDNTIGWSQDGFLEFSYVTEQEAQISLIKLKKWGTKSK